MIYKIYKNFKIFEIEKVDQTFANLILCINFLLKIIIKGKFFQKMIRAFARKKVKELNRISSIFYHNNNYNSYN